ncbi:sigma-54 dependent transcriptional regulator [Cupriavidus necator]
MHEAQARLAAASLRAVAQELHVEVQWNVIPDHPCDVFLPVIGTANLADTCHALEGWIETRPVIALAVDLDASQLIELYAAGIGEFVMAPVNPAECLARILRTTGKPHAPWANCSAVPCRDLHPLMSPKLADLIGASAAFAKPLSMLPTIAGCEAGVLLLGETGTGKEVFAQAIHYLSARASRPWVAVNCAGVPPELLESELFGHLRGAFTSASETRAGLVREAEGGTLFLDEVDALPLAAQPKLLRFLEDKTYRPVGGSRPAVADIRIIAASNQDLAHLVQVGRFRRDLFFRLNVLAVTLPPLRERSGDIALLARHFVRKACARARRPALDIAAAVLDQLIAYEWPGNVRELRHAIERAVLLAERSASSINTLDFGPFCPSPGAAGSLADESFQSAKARVVERFERSYIERLLSSCQGNVTSAAKLARKDRRAFFELMRKHKILSEAFRTDNADNGVHW